MKWLPPEGGNRGKTSPTLPSPLPPSSSHFSSRQCSGLRIVWIVWGGIKTRVHEAHCPVNGSGSILRADRKFKRHFGAGLSGAHLPERIGNSKSIFALASQERAPCNTPAPPASGRSSPEVLGYGWSRARMRRAAYKKFQRYCATAPSGVHPPQQRDMRQAGPASRRATPRVLSHAPPRVSGAGQPTPDRVWEDSWGKATRGYSEKSWRCLARRTAPGSAGTGAEEITVLSPLPLGEG